MLCCVVMPETTTPRRTKTQNRSHPGPPRRLSGRLPDRNCQGALDGCETVEGQQLKLPRNRFMPIYSLKGIAPELPHPQRYWLAPDAHVIGRVRLGADVSVWFGAALRGD